MRRGEREDRERALDEMTRRILEKRRGPALPLLGVALRTRRATHQLTVPCYVSDFDVRACLKEQQDAINAREDAEETS